MSPLPAVNVASVAQRSPLRYPEGRTLLIPSTKNRLKGSTTHKPRVLMEPSCRLARTLACGEGV